MTDAARPDTRTRVLCGTLAAVERLGMAKTSLEDVAQAAGVSRATIYRWFPGGRDQVITETVAWEVERFLTRIAEAVEGCDTVQAKFEAALLTGHRAIGEHLLLQQILATEPQELFRELAQVGPLMQDAITAYIAGELDRAGVQDGVELDEAADYCARLYLSYIGSHGATDLGDPDDVARLVETQFLGGILQRPSAG